MFEEERVISKRHLRQRKPKCGLQRVALGRVGDSGGLGSDDPAMNVDRARVVGL